MRLGKGVLKDFRGFWTRYRKEKSAVIGLAFLLIAIAVFFFPHLFSSKDPYELSSNILLPPSWNSLGTDHLGRDIFSRIIWGTRVSLAFGIGAASVSLIMGLLIGSFSGYVGGSVDEILSRTQEIVLMIPSFFLLIFVNMMFGANIVMTMLIIGLTIWPSNAKIIRSQILTLKKRAYVEAAFGLGASKFRVLFYHILPNSVQSIIANSALQMGGAIITEASLSFLGLGNPNVISWGQMLFQARPYFIRSWWTAFFPGLAITILVLSINLIGDGVNKILNPRLRKRK